LTQNTKSQIREIQQGLGRAFSQKPWQKHKFRSRTAQVNCNHTQTKLKALEGNDLWSGGKPEAMTDSIET
jgi:hypothetical protein